MSKEKQCKCCKEYWWEANIHPQSGLCPNCYDYVSDLEAKLAEAQKTIEIQRKSNDALQEENLDYRYDITDTAYEQAKEMSESWKEDYEQEIVELKQQLAESEEYNKMLLEEKGGYIDLVSGYSKKCKDYEQQLAEKEKEMSEALAKQSITCLNTIEKAYQDKISFAVEQLEKVKRRIIEDTIWELTCEDAQGIIDNQIKKLKEKK